MNSALKPFWALLLVLAGVLAVVFVARNGTGSKKNLVPWREDFRAAQAEASKVNKPIFAYFGASWCGPCQRLKGTTWADPRVEAALRDYIPVHVDVDANPDLSRRYVPTPLNPDGGIPAFRVIGPDGEIRSEAVGYLDPSSFLQWLQG